MEVQTCLLAFIARLISKPFAYKAHTIISRDYPPRSKLQLLLQDPLLRPGKLEKEKSSKQKTQNGVNSCT